jgi:hypothetical protein
VAPVFKVHVGDRGIVRRQLRGGLDDGLEVRGLGRLALAPHEVNLAQQQPG